MFNEIHEECGIFGIYHNSDMETSHDVYYGLMAIQHRGQESCGIACNLNREITYHKELGLVNDVFKDDVLTRLKGKMAMGHVRAALDGVAATVANAQPLVLNYVKGTLAVAHNGNIINASELKKEFEQAGAIYQTTSDTEVIAYTIAKERLNTSCIEMAVANSMKKLVGAYSIIVMSPEKIMAARDPFGFRPLCIGRKKDGSIVFASETCALDVIDAKFERDVLPGEVVVVKNGELISIKDNCVNPEGKICIFEHIYFARPDSLIEGQFVHDARKAAGRFLAKRSTVEADIVVGVPDSGIAAAMGYSMESGLPFVEGFVKNRYIARTFINAGQSAREHAVRVKLNPVRPHIAGKRIILVDDSIVRGTTCARIVNLLREAGAKEVHVRVSSPPFKFPCFFGTDVPSTDTLIANTHSLEETRKLIGADSLEYLTIEDTLNIAPCSRSGFCVGCFTGEYPINV